MWWENTTLTHPHTLPFFANNIKESPRYIYTTPQSSRAASRTIGINELTTTYAGGTIEEWIQ
ncbi:hypothetical protein N7516_001499 [Penicillium verrucosum]|uniref:uncharacterized protein n=1 Tax=Penicillium verrucosum TaxID=60171 RepID=UPI00254597F0|nr:uncharacterized protein N7516_001499 [Penicillium verrucosum]KAJ5941331.1 hypothetical protein N7516_001499 [Penicillium verrucosum]